MIKFIFIPNKVKMNKTAVVVIDLDNTLICAIDKYLYHLDKSINIENIIIRPHAFEFITKLRKLAMLILFTSGTRDYALNCLNVQLYPIRESFSIILTRNDCLKSNALFGKYKHSEYVRRVLYNIYKRDVYCDIYLVDDDAKHNADNSSSSNEDYIGYEYVYNIKPFHDITTKSSDDILLNVYRDIKRRLRSIK
jgi:NLI interacting factor-like phosphatase